MIGNIIGIEGTYIRVKASIDISNQANLINIHVIFDDGKDKIVGEIIDIKDASILNISIVGEIRDEKFYPGISKKPSFKSEVRIITLPELVLLLGSNELTGKQISFGTSSIYSNYKINIPINEFFSHHFAVLGNTGSGKSFGVAKLLQSIFTSLNKPVNSNIVMFDAFGEYDHAFNGFSAPSFNYKSLTTNTRDSNNELLRIPLWLLGVDDLSLLLGVTDSIQVPIIEKALKLVAILVDNSDAVLDYKNDIIARAIIDILISGNPSSQIRDQIIAILSSFNTKTLNLESQIVQPGYIRTLRQCLYIDKTGKIQEMELVVEFLSGFIKDGLEEKTNDGSIPYTLLDLEKALDFALISEGILKSNKVFDYANILSVRLHSLINSEYSEYFEYPRMISKDEYIKSLFLNSNNEKCQIVNFNINYVDDRMAKVITKIITKMLFDFVVKNENRGSIPFHIVIEEAHRYIQNDIDTSILGYNIFDRIAKEGRKYGILLGLITQRPSELSDTSISQCSNFLILRTLHPKDLDYIENMVPSISSEVVEELKLLQPGNCIAFGTAFKVPVAIKIDLPNPSPHSNNVDILKIW